MDISKPILGYWNIRGLVSNVRYQLAYCGVDYTMKRYGVEGAPDWHAADKPKLSGEGMDFANLPYFIDGDVKIAETIAVHQYIAAKYKPELLGPSDAVTQAKLQGLNFVLYDFKMKVTMPCYTSGELDEIVKAGDGIIPKIIAYLGDKKFLGGDAPVYQDFYLFEAYQCMLHLTGGKLFETYPKLKDFHENMKNLPGLKEFLETCEDKDLTFNASMAKLNGKAGY